MVYHYYLEDGNHGWVWCVAWESDTSFINTFTTCFNPIGDLLPSVHAYTYLSLVFVVKEREKANKQSQDDYSQMCCHNV